MPDFDTVALPVFRGLDRFAAGLTRGFMQRGEIEAARRERRRQEDLAERLRQADLARRQREKFSQIVEGLSQNLLGRKRGTATTGGTQQKFTLDELKALREQLGGEDVPIGEARRILEATRQPKASGMDLAAARAQLDPAAQLRERQRILESPEFEAFTRNLSRASDIDPFTVVDPFFENMRRNAGPREVVRPVGLTDHPVSGGTQMVGQGPGSIVEALAGLGNDAADIPAAPPVEAPPQEALARKFGVDPLATREAADQLRQGEFDAAAGAPDFAQRQQTVRGMAQLGDNFTGQRLENNVISSLNALHQLPPQQLAQQLPGVINQTEADLRAILEGIRPKNAPVPRDLGETLRQARWRAEALPEVGDTLRVDDALAQLEAIPDPQSRLLAYEQSVFDRMQRLSELARQNARTTPLENLETTDPSAVRDRVFTEEERAAIGLPSDGAGPRRLTGEEFALLGLDRVPAFTRAPQGSPGGKPLGEGAGVRKTQGQTGLIQRAFSAMTGLAGPPPVPGSGG